MKSKQFFFTAKLSYAECEDLYRDQIKYIIVTDLEGKRIRLPKINMQKFITPQGIVGQFVLEVDHNNKIQSIKRVE